MTSWNNLNLISPGLLWVTLWLLNCITEFATNATWQKRMLLGANIQIRAFQISDNLVYIKVQRTSNLTEIMCPHVPHWTVNEQTQFRDIFCFTVSRDSKLCTGDNFSCVLRSNPVGKNRIQITVYVYTKHIQSIQIQDYIRLKYKEYLNLMWPPTEGISTLT